MSTRAHKKPLAHVVDLATPTAAWLRACPRAKAVVKRAALAALAEAGHDCELSIVLTGDAAVRLWELTTGWLEFPRVYEVQRPKHRADLEAIATAFAPYLAARDWVSVANPTP